MLGLFGTLFILIFLPLTALLTPGFTPLSNTISSLGWSTANSLFGIGLIAGGSLLIPFYIYLERQLLNIKESVRGVTTGLAIFINACLALIGIPPDRENIEAFQAFHAFVTIVGFLGSSIHIVFYSIMMRQSSKSLRYKGPIFKKYLVCFGIFIGVLVAIYLIVRYIILEWIVGAFMVIWALIAALQGISFKFSKLQGAYHNKTQYPEVIQLFKDQIQILDYLENRNEPRSENIKENIEYVKSEIKKKPVKLEDY